MKYEQIRVPQKLMSEHRKHGVASSSRSVEYPDGNVLAVHERGARKYDDEMRLKYVFPKTYLQNTVNTESRAVLGVLSTPTGMYYPYMS